MAISTVAFELDAERVRQVVGEGFSHEHDDLHASGRLARAASCYAIAMRMAELQKSGRFARFDLTKAPGAWPFDQARWKFDPKNPRRALVKAGALIIAEIERMDRATAREGKAVEAAREEALRAKFEELLADEVASVRLDFSRDDSGRYGYSAVERMFNAFKKGHDQPNNE